MRHVGDVAKHLAVTNPANTVFDVLRLLGRKVDDDAVSADVKLWPFAVLADAAMKPVIEVRARGWRGEGR